MVFADKAAQIRADLARRFKSRSLGGGFLVFRQDIRTLGVMFQVAEDADGKDVPWGALVADENEVLRLLQRLGIGILHLALFVEVSELPGQSHKHLHVKERAVGKGFAQLGERWTKYEQILLPGDVLFEFVVEIRGGLCSHAFLV